jgi:hypothetical protein
MFESAAAGVEGGDEGAVSTATLTSLREALSRDVGELSPKDRIDRIRALEELRSAVAAAQAVETAKFITERREQAVATAITRTTDDGRRPLSRTTQLRRAERSAQAEIALARRVSPAQGSKHAGFAVVLTTELPCTLAALREGRVSEWRAQLVARETIWLSAKHRATVDREIADELEKTGDKRLETALRALAYQLDPEGFLERARGARDDRRVTVRVAPDVMAYLTAYLPMTDAVAVQKALTQIADRLRADGDPRSRGQIQADTLVDLVLGRTTSGELGISVEINLLLGADTLTGTGPDADEPGWLDGYGPIPAPAARELALGTEAAEPAAEDSAARSIRRVFADPDTGDLVAMESHRRRFTSAQRHFLLLRDQGICRTPWCNAPIRHVDHLVPAEARGPTSVNNGDGLCEHCNYVKQAAGWRARPTDCGPAPDIEITTPTGHTYRSPCPTGGPPSRPPGEPLDAELFFARLLVTYDRAA